MTRRSLALLAELSGTLDPVLFARTVGLEPEPWQVPVLRSPSKRILLNCHRQAGKSTVASLIGSHTAVYRPGSLVLLVSPSQRQSAELFRKVTTIVKRLPEPPKLEEDNKLSMTFVNGSRIVSLPSNEETIRGFSGAALIIEDEASRVTDEVYKAIRPMILRSGGRLFLMSTPWGKRGHFWEEWDRGKWERHQLVAEDNPRIDKAFLVEERSTLGAWWYEQEYGCVFHDPSESLFSEQEIRGAVSDAVKPLFEEGEFE